MLVCWCVGDLELIDAGVWVTWSSKMLLCWCVGDLELIDASVLVCG